MEKTKNSQIFSYIGAGFMLLTLLLSFIRIAVPMIGMGLGLLFDMGKLGEANGLMYLISLLGIGLLAYCAYVTFKIKADFMKAAYACFAYFIILFIMYFIVKGDIVSLSGLSTYEAQFANQFIKMGFGLFMPLLAGGAYFMAEKAAIKEKAEQ